MLNKQDEKIFVDLDDEITFVVERIRDAEADRIVLVAPEGAAVISSLVSLKLLSKLVFKRGKSLVLVTLDEGAQKFATRAGVPVLKRVADISEGIWLESENRLRKRGMNPVLGKKDEEREKKEENFEVEGDDGIVESESQTSSAFAKATADKKDKGQTTKEDELVSGVETAPVTVTVPDTDSDDFYDTEKQLEAESLEIEEDTETPSFLRNKEKKEIVDQEVSTEPSLEEFGFVVGQDVAKIDRGIISKKPEKIIEKREFVSDFHSEEEEKSDNLHAVGRDMTSYELKEPVREKLNPKRILSAIKLPKFGMPKFNAKLLIPIIIILLILAGVGGVYAYFVAPEATLTAQVKYETVNLEQEIRASLQDTDVDLENLKIPLVMQEVEESGSDSRAATGNEVRGEKAKGKVTLVNKTESDIQINAGTVMTGDGYKFKLLNNENIPKTDYFAGLGKAEVSVEAYDIGEEYNLASGTEFVVEGFTSTAMLGRSFAAFSGGTKKEVVVVTADDRRLLKESLEQSLQEKVKNKVKAQVGSGFEIRDEMISVETVEENYDVEAGAETSAVNLNMKVKARAYVYSADDIKTLGNQLLLSQVATGLKLLEEQSEYSGDFIRRDGDDAIIIMKAMGVISGDITETSVKESIAGKKVEDVESFMNSLESITSFELTLGPDWLPEKFKHVPTIKGKIEVKLEVDKGEAETVETTEE